MRAPADCTEVDTMEGMLDMLARHSPGARARIIRALYAMLSNDVFPWVLDGRLPEVQYEEPKE